MLPYILEDIIIITFITSKQFNEDRNIFTEEKTKAQKRHMIADNHIISFEPRSYDPHLDSLPPDLGNGFFVCMFVFVLISELLSPSYKKKHLTI